MPFHRRLLRKIIPKEIRKPISKVTQAIEEKILDPVSEVTEKIEDAVRPVTDPVRKFVSKAIPKELKPLLRTGIAVAGASGGPITAFLTSAAYDAYLQKLMTDPDAADTDIDFLAALQSGLGGSIKAASALPTKTGADISDPFSTAYKGLDTPVVSTPTGQPPISGIQASVPTSAPITTASLSTDAAKQLLTEGTINTADKISNIAIKGAQEAAPFLTAPTMDTFAGSLTEGLKQTGKLATGLSALQTPTVVRDTMQAIEEQEDALAASEAAQKANYDALQEQRVASMLGSFERAGFEPEETQREIEEEGLTVSLEEVQDYFNKVRQFVAKGGRIGFQDGSRGDLKAAVESFIRDFPQFEDLEGVELYKKMEEKGYLSDRDELSQGGRIGFQEGTQEGPMTMGMGIGKYIEEERIRRKMLDRVKRMMNEKAFNMQQDLPGPVMRNLNMLNPFDKDPTGQQEIFDMKNRYMDTMDAMRDQGIERAKEMNKKLEKFMPAPKQDFESYVNMIDKNFPARNNTEGRAFANEGGRMTPEGDPISPDVPPGMQMDLRGGGFIPLGTKPRADDVPAMVGKNEFVLNDRAVSGIGKMLTGNPDPRAGARALYELQENMEAIV